MNEKVEVNSDIYFNIVLKTDKNSVYSVIFILDNSIEITAKKINNGLIHESFTCRYSLKK